MIQFDKNNKKHLVAGVAAVVVIIFAIFAISKLFDGKTDLDESVASAAGQSGQSEESTSVEFPLSLEAEGLEINSLFQFSGINTDCKNQEGEDIASITLKNMSDRYLAEAKITVTLEDDTQINFTVTDLPAGMSAMAFSLENQSIPADVVCVDVSCDAVFDDTASMQSDKITAESDGTQITLTNISNETISQIVVYCRDSLGEEYFGGMTYQYTVDNLNAGESTTVDAVDCILGMAEVVRIVIN